MDEDLEAQRLPWCVQRLAMAGVENKMGGRWQAYTSLSVSERGKTRQEQTQRDNKPRRIGFEGMSKHKTKQKRGRDGRQRGNARRGEATERLKRAT